MQKMDKTLYITSAATKQPSLTNRIIYNGYKHCNQQTTGHMFHKELH